ncbi:uncharacterized protein [Antedon mediterranea]|uniref:uncharacterized protein isoform X2 n=1 Tax=Antedon mediterranea TaxID=105859 RepID=UPI003AF6B0B1
MGRKLNLSHLSDGECRQILDVIQRDFRLRQKEKDRIGILKKKVEEEEEKRSVLSRQQAFNQKHCMRCFSAFGMLFNKRGQCVVCHYFFCKECRICVHSILWICKGCITERQLQSQAFEWYYDKIKDRFRRYGSAKVVRSLYKRKSNEYSESPSDQSNTDSGFEHQLSPHRRNNSIPLEDKSTNTDKELLESMRPDMETVSTQWPPANRRNSYTRSESLSPDTESWQNIRLDPNIYKNNTSEISVEVFCEKMPTSPISKGITQHERFSAGIQPAVDPAVTHLKSLSPIPEMSSPECTEDSCPSMIGENEAEEKGIRRKKSSSRSRGIFGKINGSPLRLIKRGYPKSVTDDIDLNMIEENAKQSDEEADMKTSDILEASSSKQIRLDGIHADSVESVSDVSLPSMDGTDVDSLETQYLSAHSNLTTPDIENDSPSTPSTPVPGMLSLGKTFSQTFWDDVSFPHSSSSETLKSDQGDTNNDTQFFSTEEFLDEISNRSPTSQTPCSSEEDLFKKRSDDKNRQGSEDRTSPSSFASAKSYSTEYHTAQSELDSRVTSPQSAKTTSSSEYFTAFSEFSETKEDEQNNNSTRDSDESLSCCSSHESLSAKSEEMKTNFPQKNTIVKNIKTPEQAIEISGYAEEYDEDEETPNNSPTNKLIRYDSLSLVVEVSEDDGDLPDQPIPAYQMPRFSADYDSGHDSYSSESDHGRRRALRHYFQYERRFSPSSEEDPHSRQASFDSVDSYSHKSASLSSRQASIESTRTSDAGQSRKSSPDVELPINTEFCSDVNAQRRNPDVISESGTRESEADQQFNLQESETLNSAECSESTQNDTTDVLDKLLEVNYHHVVDTLESKELCEADVEKDTCQNDKSDLRDGLTPHEQSTPEEETLRNLIKTVPSMNPTAAIILQSPPEKKKMLSTKAELDLTNLSKKVLMRRDEVLESAEEMLTSANQMTEINDQMEELEQCLSSLEKTLAGDSDSDNDDSKHNRGDLSPQDRVVDDVHKLEQKLQVHDHCLGMETEQTAAIAVRMITNTALKVIATTENVIETEHAQIASVDVNHSTTESSSLSLHNDGKMLSVQETSVDSVKDLIPLTNANEIHNSMQMITNTGVKSQVSESHVCNTDIVVNPNVEENGNCVVNDQSVITNSSHSSTNLTTSSMKSGARRKDSMSGCRKKMKGMSEDEPAVECIDEVANEITHLEEKVYLSASHVFSLEDKLSKLESQVRGLDITASEELIGGLEDELALTLAQVAHSENQVCSAEDRIDQLKSRTGFVQGEEKEDKFSNFLTNVSEGFQAFSSSTESTPANSATSKRKASDGIDTIGEHHSSQSEVSNESTPANCEISKRKASDCIDTIAEHHSSRSEVSNSKAVSPKEIYCSSLHEDDVDGEYALESDEDEIFLVASSSIQTDFYQKPSSYGTFTRSISQPEVGTSARKKVDSFNDKRSVSVTDVSWEMPGMISFLDDSNIEFQPYSSSEEFSDDSQRINGSSNGSQRTHSTSGSDGSNEGNGDSQVENVNGQRNSCSDGNQDNNGSHDNQRNNSERSGESQTDVNNQHRNNGNNQVLYNETINGDTIQRDNDKSDSCLTNNCSDHNQKNGSSDDSQLTIQSSVLSQSIGDLISFNVNEEICVPCDINKTKKTSVESLESGDSHTNNDESVLSQQSIDDLISFNVNEEICGLAIPEGSQNNVSSLVFSSEANFNSQLEQGHTDTRTQSDIQFQNDLPMNSSYIES